MTDPRTALAAIALAELGVVEVGPNRGPRVEEYIRAGGGRPGDPWCAAFMTWCGLELAKRLRDPWPLKRHMGCVAMAEDARLKRLRYLKPTTGAIFLLWYPRLNRYAHTGLILGPGERANEWETVEGNTNPGGGREGYGVFERVRTFGANDRFIRWWYAYDMERVA